MIDQEQQVKRANKNFYDIVKSSYEDIDGRRSEGLTQYVAGQLKFVSQKTDSESVLDLGCGSGFISRIAREYFNKRVAIDISSQILKSIRHNSILKITGDLDFIPVKSETFSCVVTFSVLHHCYSFEKMSREIFRILKKGGLFYSDHDMDSHFYKRFGIILKIYRKIHNTKNTYLLKFKQLTEDIYNYSEYHQEGIPSDTIKKLLTETGFRDVKMNFHWFGLSPLVDKVFRKKSFNLGYAPLVRILAKK